MGRGGERKTRKGNKEDEREIKTNGERSEQRRRERWIEYSRWMWTEGH